MVEVFPYKPRKCQRDIIQDITVAIRQKKHFVFESGTGSGKTVCVLSSTLEYALKHQKKIIYTTRTNAQQRQVIIELRAIRDKTKDKRIFGVGMQGRANMCLLAHDDPDITNGSSEELSRFCSHKKKQAMSSKGKGCPYYRHFMNDKEKVDIIVDWAKNHLPTTEEFVDYCEHQAICPYEINKLIVHDALIIVVPYVYVFDKTIRIKLLDWLAVSDEEILLIVDEAHNLPGYLRELFSAELSTWMLNSSVFEAEKFGDPSLGDGRITVSKFCKELNEIVSGLRDTYVYKILESGLRKKITQEYNDAFIPSHEFESEILGRLHLTSKTFRDIISDLIAYGEKIQEYKQKGGKLPRSYLHRLGIFLEFWMNVEMDQYIKLVVDESQGKNPRIEAFCVDPSIGASIINEFHSSIHMSGTLKPLEEYRDSLGLSEETQLLCYPSPFSLENRRIFFSGDVTTRYEDLANDKTIFSRMWHYITTICNTFPRNTMVFFPSFNTLSHFREHGCFPDIKRCLYVEEQGMKQSEIMELVSDFKACGNGDGATLFSVVGGRISEGMDFPAEELEIAVIVGIPYPKPTARQRGLQRYYDLKFGKGWEYTVEAPAARKLLQSIGRLIRDEEDRGVAVILDKRAPRFQKYIQDMRESRHLIQDISGFLKTE